MIELNLDYEVPKPPKEKILKGTNQKNVKRKLQQVGETSEQDQPPKKKQKTVSKKERSKLKTIEIVPVYKPEDYNLQEEEEVIMGGLMFNNAEWNQLGLCEKMVTHLKDVMKFDKPTDIQSKAIPQILNKKNVLVKALTGSGKTMVYLIPVLQQLQSQTIHRNDGTYVIIMTPTRELSKQIFDILKKLCKPWNWIVSGCITGGEKKKSEKARLRKGLNIVVATPGRLLDHLENTSCFDLSKLSHLIFDEADRLLDFGFEKDIMRILSIFKEKTNDSPRQTLLLSATLNSNVSRLAELCLTNPVLIGLQENEGSNINTDGYGVHEIPEGLTQYYTVVPPKKRLVVLASFIRWKVLTEKYCKMIVFVSNCETTNFFHSLLSNINFPDKPPSMSKKEIDSTPMIPCHFFKLNGNMSQEDRSNTYSRFKVAKTAVLICTDVASRGLDLPNVSWIVQYDAPSDPSAYIHRIGRTARIGKEGNALLFVMPTEEKYINILKSKNMNFSNLPLDDIRVTLVTNLERNPSHSVEVEEGALQYKIQTMVEEGHHDIDLKTMAIKSFQSYLRSYATHVKQTKSIFHIKNLHLGHISKSFGLADTPTDLGKILKVRKPKEEDKEEKKKLKSNVKYSDEFEAGM